MRKDKVLTAGAGRFSSRGPTPPLCGSDAGSPFGADVVLSRQGGRTDHGGSGSLAQFAAKLVNLRIHEIEAPDRPDQSRAEGCWIR